MNEFAVKERIRLVLSLYFTDMGMSQEPLPIQLGLPKPGLVPIRSCSRLLKEQKKSFVRHMHHINLSCSAIYMPLPSMIVPCPNSGLLFIARKREIKSELLMGKGGAGKQKKKNKKQGEIQMYYFFQFYPANKENDGLIQKTLIALRYCFTIKFQIGRIT